MFRWTSSRSEREKKSQERERNSFYGPAKLAMGSSANNKTLDAWRSPHTFTRETYKCDLARSQETFFYLEEESKAAEEKKKHSMVSRIFFRVTHIWKSLSSSDETQRSGAVLRRRRKKSDLMMEEERCCVCGELSWPRRAKKSLGIESPTFSPHVLYSVLNSIEKWFRTTRELSAQKKATGANRPDKRATWASREKRRYVMKIQ